MGTDILQAAYMARMQWEHLGNLRRHSSQVRIRRTTMLGHIIGLLLYYFA